MTFWQKWSNAFRKIPAWSIILGVGILFLLLGFFGGQFHDIRQKAIMICLECIGIG